AFDPARCGAFRGRVEWLGEIPPVGPMELIQLRNPPSQRQSVPNPNAPQIKEGRVADAFVWLSGVDGQRSIGWNPVPTSVEVRRAGLLVRQGNRVGKMGVVRRGDAVDLLSRDPVSPTTPGPELHSIRGRGTNFFTQALPIPDQPVHRALSHEGIVE